MGYFKSNNINCKIIIIISLLAFIQFGAPLKLILNQTTAASHPRHCLVNQSGLYTRHWQHRATI